MKPTNLVKQTLPEIKTHRELHGKDPEIGYEWDAGNTPPGDKSPGRWTVKRTTENWMVLFRSFLSGGGICHTNLPANRKRRESSQGYGSEAGGYSLGER